MSRLIQFVNAATMRVGAVADAAVVAVAAASNRSKRPIARLLIELPNGRYPSLEDTRTLFLNLIHKDVNSQSPFF